MFVFAQPEKLRGFARGLVPERIIGATDSTGELMFLMKWFVDAAQPGRLVSRCLNLRVFLFVFFGSMQEKFRRSRLGAGEGGQRQVSAGGHLLLRREAHLALVSHRRREEGRQKLTPGGGRAE